MHPQYSETKTSFCQTQAQCFVCWRYFNLVVMAFCQTWGLDQGMHHNRYLGESGVRRPGEVWRPPPSNSDNTYAFCLLLLPQSSTTLQTLINGNGCTSCMKYRHGCRIISPNRFSPTWCKNSPFLDCRCSQKIRANYPVTILGDLGKMSKNCNIVTYQFPPCIFFNTETYSMMLFRQDAPVVLWGKAPNWLSMLLSDFRLIADEIPAICLKPVETHFR